jgi:copper chaperone CopZ
MNTKVFKVEGMICNHCKDRIKTHLLRLKNVEAVDVNLTKKEVAINGKNIYEDHVKKIINGLGYYFVGDVNELVDNKEAVS